MPKYTYQISFNSSDYSTLTPGKEIVMDGFWEEGTKIWREQINELYITKRDNSSTYTTLESWFEDETKFETQIFVKILKNDVQESLHWFGVKWGTLNKHQTTYIVQPIVDDLWSQYFESTKDESQNFTTDSDIQFSYYDTTGTYPFLSRLTGTRLESFIEDTSNLFSGWPRTDVVSSFIWQSDYEDASSVGTYRGMPLDYVTQIQSYLTVAGLRYPKGVSFSKMLEMLRLIRVWVFFDTNDKLRFEHIKFFNDRLTDNAVDYSSYIEDYDDEWSYLDVTTPPLETVVLQTKDDDTDTDFASENIKYSDVRNRADATPLEFISQFSSNLGYYDTSGVGTDRDIIWGGHRNHTYAYFNGDATSLTNDYNSFTVSYNSSDYWGSNDFRTESDDYIFTTFVSSLSGSAIAYIADRSTEAILSNNVIINSTGLTTLTLICTAQADDAYLKFVARTNGSMTADYVTLVNDTNSTVSVIPSITAIVSNTIKTNGSFSVGNIIDSWWQDDRLSREATINGSDYDFNGTQYNLARKEIRIHLDTVPNPLYGFNDGTRVGMIEKWSRDLDTDYYTIYLIYQEDE
jgi:hypothetical protein